MNIIGESTLCVNLDWLQYSGVILDVGADTDVYCPSGYRIEVMRETKVFARHIEVYDFDGTKCLSMLWMPRNRIMNPLLINVQIANTFLYSNELSYMVALANNIIPHRYTNLTRIDVCTDFQLNNARRMIIRGFLTGRSYIGNKKMTNYWCERIDGIQMPYDLNFGTKKSDFKWKIYNKSKELDCRVGGNFDKPYIWQNWQEVGFDINNVWRIEISMTKLSGFLVKMPFGDMRERKISVTDIITNDTIYRFAKDMYEKRFQIRKKQGHTRVVNDELLHLIDYPDIGTIQLDRLKSSEPKEKSEVTRMFNVLVKLADEPLAFTNIHILMQLIEQIDFFITHYNLYRYFAVMKGSEYVVWRERKIENCGINKVIENESVNVNNGVDNGNCDNL